MPQAATYNTAGNREDLTNILSRLAPEDTPVFNRLSKTMAASAMLTEFQVDDLGAPQFGGQPEGVDVTNFDNKSKDREKLDNRQEKFRETYQVTEEQELVDTAGVASEVAEAKAKCNIQIKNDMESSICSDQVKQAGTGGQNSRMDGLGALSDPTNVNIPALYRTPAASVGVTATLTETTYTAVLQSRFESVGKKGTMMQVNGPNLQGKISDFTRAEGTTTAKPFQVNIMAEAKKVVLSVLEYDSDWGVIDMVPTLFNGRVTGGAITAQVRDRGYGFSPDNAEIRFLQRPFMRVLEDKGGGPRGFAQAICTLVFKNSRDLYKFT